jgi:hypothetical protein
MKPEAKMSLKNEKLYTLLALAALFVGLYMISAQA